MQQGAEALRENGDLLSWTAWFQCLAYHSMKVQTWQCNTVSPDICATLRRDEAEGTMNILEPGFRIGSGERRIS